MQPGQYGFKARMPAIYLCSAAGAGTGRHNASFRSESWEPKRFILLKALVELGATPDDFADTCRDDFGFERGDRDLPGRGLISCVAGSTPLRMSLCTEPTQMPSRSRLRSVAVVASLSPLAEKTFSA
jgi:hypothetical protein